MGFQEQVWGRRRRGRGRACLVRGHCTGSDLAIRNRAHTRAAFGWGSYRVSRSYSNGDWHLQLRVQRVRFDRDPSEPPRVIGRRAARQISSAILLGGRPPR